LQLISIHFFCSVASKDLLVKVDADFWDVAVGDGSETALQVVLSVVLLVA
jgi:hypothetical protein